MPLVRLGHKVQRVRQVLDRLVQQVPQVRREVPDLKVQLEPPDLKVRLEPPEHKGRPELQVPLVRQEVLGLKVRLEPQVLLEPLARLVQLEPLDQAVQI